MPKQKKIIIADGDIATTEMYKEKLGEYDIMTADNGTSAIKMIKQEKPDLVLLEILISEKDGFEVMWEIKKNKDEKIRSTPFFIFSRLASEQDKYEAEELGIAGYEIKTKITVAELIEKINKFLKK
jgi:two-component system, OmpR family, alkaline phosphatase synthesis response regulator PhoP